jgi:sterol desaturase/sphingolipid hydroxylase (fatty acid hydroxylase superfamily)
MDVVAASIPLFFLLIAVEVLVARRLREPFYRFNDSIADLSCGILSQLSGLFMILLTYGAFAWLGEHWSVYRWFDLPPWPQGSPLVASEGALGFVIAWPALASWTVVFVLADLAYYWLHRLSHEINFLWAGHVVHHSSEEYNLTVALRQSSLDGLVSWVFYMPLAVIGIPWIMFAVCHGINLIYQFWIHTREIDKLGPLETVMNTPSHHRVHHGVNPKYQDRNYAGVFIVWDKLFGTFVPEEEEPVYGITIPLRTWNPIIANIHVFQEMFRNAWRTRRWRDKLKVIFGPPSWRPDDIGPPIVAQEVSRDGFIKFDTKPPTAVTRYVAIQFVILLLGAVVLLRVAGDLPVYQVVAGGFYIGIGLSSLGSMLEARRWAASLEFARLLMLVILAVGFTVIPRFPFGIVLAVGAFAVASLGWVWRVRPALAATPQPA